MALRSPPAPGGRELRRRARQDDGGREPADSPVEIRSRGARGHPAHGKGRGGRQEHERVSGLRGADVSKWRSAEATASA